MGLGSGIQDPEKTYPRSDPQTDVKHAPNFADLWELWPSDGWLH
jgi:hypothetical protein